MGAGADTVSGMAEHGGPVTSTESGRRAFIQTLNDRLPRKRVIAQGVLRNEDGEVLLCELTYKAEWDLPGGVVDPDESPATAVERELREELGVEVEVRGLLAVNWLPPWRGWDDAVLLLFDLGTVGRGFTDGLTLSPREIAGVHWCPPELVAERAAPYTTRMLERVAAGEHTAYPVYFENSDPRDGGA